MSVGHHENNIAVTEISHPQELILQQIRAAGNWNEFRGDNIASALEQKSLLWRAVYFTRASSRFFPESGTYGFHHQVNLLPLRELAEGYLYHDTLFILPASDAHLELEALVSSWQADEVSWCSLEFIAKAMGVNRRRYKDMFPDEQRAVLQIWWD